MYLARATGANEKVNTVHFWRRDVNSFEIFEFSKLDDTSIGREFNLYFVALSLLWMRLPYEAF